MKTGEGWMSEEMVYRKKDGRRVYGLLSVSPVKDELGQVVESRSIIIDITERKLAEEALQKKNYELGERVKELNCLYGISSLVEKSGTFSQEIFQGVVNLIPQSWQDPDITCARIILEDKVYSSSKFNETQWRQTANIASNGEKVGSVEVFYLEAKPEEAEGPFLREERLLLNVIAELLGRTTGRKRAEEALRESENKHRVLFETMAQGAVYQDADGMIISANPAAESILGLTLDEMQGRTSLDPRWKTIHEDGSDFPGETHPSMVALGSGKAVFNVIMGVYHPRDEEWRWINVNAVPEYKPGAAEPFRVYTTFTDITEAKRAKEALQANEERFRKLSIEDPLTGIFNRRYFFEQGAKVVNRSVKDDGDVCLGMLDIDNFKKTNDEYGHQAGDYILREFAGIVSGCIRPDDILARYGGEEFVVVYHDCELREATRIMTRVKEIVERHIFKFNDIEIRTTVSGGIAYFGEVDSRGTILEDMVKLADKRMYMAKQHGRNRIVYQDL